MGNVQTLGIVVWLPVAFVETFILVVAVKRLAEMITGKHESIKFS